MNSSPDVADHPARILIVDDERHNRQLLEVMLKPEGFLLLTAVKGTSFKVYFPRADAPETIVEAPPPIARPRSDGAHTVLVVEDAEGLRELTKRLLERQGYTVLLAGNADDALRLFERNASIDVLLTDVVMPGASGPELTRQLVERRPALRVIYMSGYTEDAIVQHGVLNPGIAFLQKPFTSEALARKVREVLDR